MHYNKLLVISFLLSCSISQAFQWGFAERQGHRPSMEDAHIIRQDDKNALFALFDGHGGKEVSTYASQQLSQAFCANHFVADVSGVSDWIKKLESEIEILGYKSGSTMITVHIDKTTHIGNFFWVGDSRAIVIRNGIVITATEDHKPHALGEKDRIVAAGGCIINGYCTINPWIVGFTVSRSIGGLAVSRTIGDLEFRKQCPFILSDPTVQSVSLQKDDLLVIACDGVWDVFSNNDLADYITKLQPQIIDDALLQAKGRPDHASSDGDLKTLAQNIRDKSFELGSRDNISVIIVKI